MLQRWRETWGRKYEYYKVIYFSFCFCPKTVNSVLRKELATLGITSAVINCNTINHSESVLQTQLRRAEVFQDMSNSYVYHLLSHVVNQDLQPTGDLPLKAELLQTGLKENTEPRQASVKDKNSEGSAAKEEKAGHRPSGKPGLLAQWPFNTSAWQKPGKKCGLLLVCQVRAFPGMVWTHNGFSKTIFPIVPIPAIFNNSKAIERKVHIEASAKNFPFQVRRRR